MFMSGFEDKARPLDPAPAARAKLFTHGGSQAVRLPKAFRFEGDEVEVRRDGSSVVLGSPRRQGGAELWASIDANGTGDPLPYPVQPLIEREPIFDDEP